ncbi:MAG: tRNA (N(6)-L-threonylcarbamoyladenosine(37)-C(2))-methylthiotransferase MtaB [Tannerella sp.]|jgi:threonylcarbamoyladenosine tRNA methylthiotransferase MtaB|nr:tRNA (N(6)-L-threonylcarbamoyladenosine(37)-C(2))-methylthiotransferase MtaB [Tannerella sp.]
MITDGNSSFEGKTLACFTLGCKLNFAETSAIGRELKALGVRRADQGEEADFCIINTCSVTELADKKCRQLIRKVIKAHPQAFVIVTGCYAQLKPEDVAAIEGVDLVVGASEKGAIASLFAKPDTTPKPNRSPFKPNRSPRPVRFDSDSVFYPSCSADDRTRHFLKVQDGCDYFCSYCTIPFARGRSRNGAIADLVRQAQEAAAAGGKEIVLTGVNIGDFGKTTGERFIDLIDALDRVEGIERFRISSIEPELLTDDIIAFVADSKRFMPHFHIPLQSGSDAVLKLMRRHYDTTLFASRLKRIKDLLPDAFIGVDVIAGMRGETDELFEDGFQFIESLPFTQLHVFSYSEREGTQALKITPTVPPAVIHARSQRLLALSAQRLHRFYEAHIGSTARVLFEHARKGAYMYGFTENYIKTAITYQKELSNVITKVRLLSWDADEKVLTAELTD